MRLGWDRTFLLSTFTTAHIKNSSRESVSSMETDSSPSNDSLGTLPDDFGQTAVDIFLREDATVDLVAQARELIIRYREAF